MANTLSPLDLGVMEAWKPSVVTAIVEGDARWGGKHRWNASA